MAIHSSTLLPSSFGGAKHSKPKLLKSCSLHCNPCTSSPRSRVLLKNEEHKEVSAVAKELQKYGVNEPVKCPLIFGEWDVVYCSVPTSPGGGYRSALGRLVFKTKEMIQVVEAPESVRNKVSFSAFGFLDGEVSLTGTLTALDDKWKRVVFEPHLN